MKNILILILITLIGLLSSCKQMNCQDLINQRGQALRNGNLQLVAQTDSLIVNYCK